MPRPDIPGFDAAAARYDNQLPPNLEGPEPEPEECSECRGCGSRFVAGQLVGCDWCAGSGIEPATEQCRRCDGQGDYYTPYIDGYVKEICSDCKGKGIVKALTGSRISGVGFYGGTSQTQAGGERGRVDGGLPVGRNRPGANTRLGCGRTMKHKSKRGKVRMWAFWSRHPLDRDWQFSGVRWVSRWAAEKLVRVYDLESQPVVHRAFPIWVPRP